MNNNFTKIVFFLALVGMVYLGWSKMIKPANAALATQKAQIQKDMAKLAELEREKANAENLDAQIQEMEEAIHFFENKLPHKSQIHQVLSQVSEIINRHGLKPKTNKTQKPTVSAGYIELPIQMELEGSFNSFYAFLLEMEKLDRITKVRQFKIKSDKDESGNIVAELTVSIFFQDANG